jgi:hypothetical protein
MLVKRQNGNLAGISLKHSKKFQVYEAKTIPLAIGDKIRITQNERAWITIALTMGPFTRLRISPAGETLF